MSEDTSESYTDRRRNIRFDLSRKIAFTRVGKNRNLRVFQTREISSAGASFTVSGSHRAVMIKGATVRFSIPLRSGSEATVILAGTAKIVRVESRGKLLDPLVAVRFDKTRRLKRVLIAEQRR